MLAITEEGQLMPLSEMDDEFIENSLERLCEGLLRASDDSYSDVKQYIYVHEFALALDLLAHIQLTSEVAPSLEIRNLFETLAVKMRMRDGDMWRGVARLRRG